MHYVIVFHRQKTSTRFKKKQFLWVKMTIYTKCILSIQAHICIKLKSIKFYPNIQIIVLNSYNTKIQQNPFIVCQMVSCTLNKPLTLYIWLKHNTNLNLCLMLVSYAPNGKMISCNGSLSEHIYLVQDV